MAVSADGSPCTSAAGHVSGLMLATAAVRPPVIGPIDRVGGRVLGGRVRAAATGEGDDHGAGVGVPGEPAWVGQGAGDGVGVGGVLAALAAADAANASVRVADAMSARRRWAVLM